MLSLVAALAAFQAPAGEPPAMRPGRDGRGRDPWVFRAIFEDRTRMVILTPAPNWWMAFNPETGAMHKVWRGKMDFRGKVWDFSQDNSRASGRIYLSSPSEIWRLADDGKLPAGWTANGVTFQNGSWTFANNAALTSPRTDASGWHRVFVAFDETSRKSRFRVTISDDRAEEGPQWFDSATSVDSENGWQWNFKRVERPSARMTVKLEAPTSKRLRGLRLYGDRPSWFDGNGNELKVFWDGYELVNQTRAAKIHLRLRWPSGRVAHIVHQPELTPLGWREDWTVTGIPKGETVTMRREGLSDAVKVDAATFYTPGVFRFAKDGVYRAGFNLPEGER